MKKVKLFALIVAVMTITLLSVSGAWAGPAQQTEPLPSGTGGEGDNDLLPPQVPEGSDPPGDPPQGFEALSEVGFQPVVGNTPTQVCFPASASARSQVIRYWSLGPPAQWVSLTTTVSGGQACATLTTPANVQLQGN